MSLKSGKVFRRRFLLTREGIFFRRRRDPFVCVREGRTDDGCQSETVARRGLESGRRCSFGLFVAFLVCRNTNWSTESTVNLAPPAPLFRGSSGASVVTVQSDSFTQTRRGTGNFRLFDVCEWWRRRDYIRKVRRGPGRDRDFCFGFGVSAWD